MITSQCTPVYWVTHTQSGQKPVRTRFIDPDLLTARRAALTLVEQLFQSDPFSLTMGVELQLIEERPGADDQLIALVFRRSVYVAPNGAVAGLDPIPYDEIAAQQTACLTKLKGFNDEAYYYLKHGHRSGLGYFDLGVHLANKTGPVPIGYVLVDSLGMIHAIAGSFNSCIDDGRGFECRLTYSTAFYESERDDLPFGPANHDPAPQPVLN